jgi:hypothetical protein
MNADNRQKTLAALNDLWQGNPIRRTRAGEGHATLHGRRLAMHLMVQPDVARAFMSDRASLGHRLSGAVPDLRTAQHHRHAVSGERAPG